MGHNVSKTFCSVAFNVYGLADSGFFGFGETKL